MRLDHNGKFYNAHIQEVFSENGPVVVFVEELGAKWVLNLFWKGAPNWRKHYFGSEFTSAPEMYLFLYLEQYYHKFVKKEAYYLKKEKKIIISYFFL